MHFSTYFKIYPSTNDPENFILFSTKNAAIAEIPAATATAIEKNHRNVRLNGHDQKILRSLGFLTDDPEKERRAMLDYINSLNRINKTLSVKLVMNLDCNLSCIYCFEGKRKGRFYMSKETADNFIGFVKNKLSGRKKFEEISITFYGGEPLLSRELIVYISKRIKAISERKGLTLNIYFMTNGTLLTKEFVKDLKPLGMKEACIALDGPADIHNSQRPFKKGSGSFDLILKNIKAVCDMIDIRLLGNFRKDNFERFPELLDCLDKNKLNPTNLLSVGFFPVVAETSEFAPDFREGCASVNEPWLFEASLFLREEIIKRGFHLEKIAPGLCMMEYKNNLLVNHDGDIYKCPGLIGRKEFCVGNIKTGIKDYRKSHNLDNWKNRECLECAYLPLCFGGCRYMKLVREGNMNRVECKKPYYDATLEALVKQDIKSLLPLEFS